MQHNSGAVEHAPKARRGQVPQGTSKVVLFETPIFPTEKPFAHPLHGEAKRRHFPRPGVLSQNEVERRLGKQGVDRWKRP